MKSVLKLWTLVGLVLCIRGSAEIWEDGDPPAANTISPIQRLEDMRSDELLNWEAPKYLQENFPWYVSGFDDDGRPIIIFEIGKYNYRGLLAKGGKIVQDALKFTDQTIYRVEKWADADPDGPGEVVIIYDFDGFSLSNVGSIQVTRYALNTMAKFKPLQSKIGYGFFINTNFVASGFLNAMRPFLGAFMEKFEQHGTRKDQWMPKLLRRLPKDQLPPWYGGTKNFKPLAVYG